MINSELKIQKLKIQD